jgi:hypothetical protein
LALELELELEQALEQVWVLVLWYLVSSSQNEISR